MTTTDYYRLSCGTLVGSLLVGVKELYIHSLYSVPHMVALLTRIINEIPKAVLSTLLSPPRTSITLKTTSKILSGMKLRSIDNVFAKDLNEYVSKSIGIMPNIFSKPRPPPNTTTSQKLPKKLATSLSNSTNCPSQGNKSISISTYSSTNLKILEARVFI